MARRKTAVRPAALFDERLDALLHLNPIPSSLSTLKEGRLLVVNDAALKFFEVTREEVLGKTTAALGWWVDSQQREQALRAIREQGLCHNLEVQFRARSGRIRTALWSAYPVSVGGVPHLVALAVDITERNRVKMDLEKEKAFAESLLATAQAIILVLDPQGRIVTFNPFMETLSGFSLEEVRGKDWFDTFLPKADRERIRAVFQQAASRIATKGNVNPIVTKDGREVFVEWFDTTLKDSAGGVMGIIAVGQDITERRLAEQQLHAALREKEALLKEVHHRVKNNMQIITSLLNLQADRLHDPRDKDLFQNTQDRVRAMALIHERLYQHEQFARLNLGAYLQDLVRELFRAYRVDPGRIALELELAAVELGIDQAIPCALIVNELVTNSLKYAFPGGRKGAIAISLRREEGGVSLQVRDDGPGLPADLDVQRSPSFGLTIIRILAGQLEGRLEFDRGRGTACTLTFTPSAGGREAP